MEVSCNSNTLADSNIAIEILTLKCQYMAVKVLSMHLSFALNTCSIEDDKLYLEGRVTHVFSVSDINTCVYIRNTKT